MRNNQESSSSRKKEDRQRLQKRGRKHQLCHKGTPPERVAGWQATKEEDLNSFSFCGALCLLRQRRMSLWLSVLVAGLAGRVSRVRRSEIAVLPGSLRERSVRPNPVARGEWSGRSDLL